MVQWNDSFWGEGNRGYEILSNNIKNGAIAIEEFQRFLNETAQCESTYSKNLSRLQTQFIKSQNVGTFTPIWNLIRDLIDKISSTHLITMNFYQDLLRDIHNYHELYQKKVKTHIQKDGDINRTTELITQLNNSLNNVNKSKEQYYAIALDYERSKRTGINPSSTTISQETNSPSLAQSALNSIALRQTDRLERKYRQAQDEYKLSIEKYNSIRNDYEKRFSDATTKFQAFEIDHIEKMLAFSLNYSDILQRTNDQIRSAQNDFNDKLKLLTGNDLLDIFVEQKKTGTDRPATLQFEEVDHLKTSIHLSDLPPIQDDYNQTNQFESNVPTFQAHFSVQSPPIKNTDNNRGTHSPLNDTPISPSSLNSLPISPMSTNSVMTRSQEGNGGNEQTSNPFDVKIKKTKFPGFFGTNRKDKEKKEKKTEKKPSINIKTNRNILKRNSRDDPNGNNLPNSNNENNDTLINTDNNDDFIQISMNNKIKSLTSEPSSPSISNDDSLRRNQFLSSKISTKSSNSTDSSDDDDNPMTKIFVKINQPKSQVLSDEDDETKIMNAMRLVDKNLGNFAVNSRGLVTKTPDMNKSISSGQIGTRKLPPPPPLVSRSSLTIQNSVAIDNVDHSHMFPPHDEFAQISSNTINQDNRSIPSQSTSESKNTTSISSNDDDSEVANSFPTNDLTNKGLSFPILQVPSLFQLSQRQTQPLSNSTSPSFSSMNQNLNNSPININEQGTSPLTIGGIDQIPLAIAFQETIHVIISGDNQENWKSRIVGQMLISFPSSMLNLPMDTSRATNTLEFRLKNIDNIENIITKPSLITQNEGSIDSEELNYSFDMTELNNILRNLQEKNPSSPFFNLNILNYELKQSNIPIEISSQWSRTIDTISVNIKYHFNSSMIPESIRFNNNIVIIYTIITDGQQIKQSSPNAEWSINEHKLWWKVLYTNNGTGNLTATIKTMQMDVDENDNNENPLTTSSIVKVYFLAENALFSSIDFDLVSRGYRISLLKKKILSGKYQSEPDQSEPIQLFKRPTKSSSPDT